jgi:hypothetical protein
MTPLSYLRHLLLGSFVFAAPLLAAVNLLAFWTARSCPNLLKE